MGKVYFRYFNNGVGENNFILREYTWKKKGIFETKEEALKDFKVAEIEANKKFALIKKELDQLQETLGFYIESSAVADDDSGLDSTSYIGFKISGYAFEYSLD